MPFTFIDMEDDFKDALVKTIIEDVDFDDVEINIDDFDVEIEYDVKIEIHNLSLTKKVKDSKPY